MVRPSGLRCLSMGATACRVSSLVDVYAVQTCTALFTTAFLQGLRTEEASQTPDLLSMPVLVFLVNSGEVIRTCRCVVPPTQLPQLDHGRQDGCSFRTWNVETVVGEVASFFLYCCSFL
jgi:hypothetical protein